MFSKEIPSIIFIGFVILSIYIDIKFYAKNRHSKKYNSFELYSGSYVDMAFLSVIVLIIYSFFGRSVNNVFFLYLFNFILAVLYVALFKTFLQLFVGWGYKWVDTNKERLGMIQVIFNRVSIFLYYIFVTLCYRHIALHLYQGVSGNLVSIVLVIVLSRVISHKCHKINLKLNREEEEQC